MIVSNELLDKFDKFKFLSDDLISDHYPITGTFLIKTKFLKNATIIYKNITDWEKYTNIFESKLSSVNNETVDHMNLEVHYAYLLKCIKESEKEATKTTTRKIDCKTI